MTIRKNFLLDDEIVKHLEQLAKDANTTQTQIVKTLIEERYKAVSEKEKLEAFSSLVGSMNGMLTSKSLQSIKYSLL